MGISAAHKSLPFGTRVVVRNQRTGRSITVRINDRGPFVGGRIIDLSTGAKNALGMDGLASVCLEVVSYGSGKKRGYEKPGLGGQLLEAVNRVGRMRRRAWSCGPRVERAAAPVPQVRTEHSPQASGQGGPWPQALCECASTASTAQEGRATGASTRPPTISGCGRCASPWPPPLPPGPPLACSGPGGLSRSFI